MMRTPLGCSLLALAVLAAPAGAIDRVQGGNDFYRVVITGSDRLWAQPGHYAAFTGPTHPATAYLARPGDMISIRRDCVSCGGDDDLTFSVVRSWDSRTDYVLARNPNYILAADPGFACVPAESLAPPSLETVIEGGIAVGVRARWTIHAGTDDLEVEQLLRVHGHDFVGSRVEVTVAVTNRGAAPARVGLREAWNLLVASPLTPTNPAGLDSIGSFFLGLRPSDPPTEPFFDREREWVSPTFRMWQAHAANGTPSTTPFRYSIAGAVSGPPTLNPPPTPPDLLQHAAMNIIPGVEPPPGGALDRCFEWHVPDPPRRVLSTNTMGVLSYWGIPEDAAIDLLPGEEARRTQYLVAFIDYPLAVDAGGVYETRCGGATTAVALAGSVTLAEPTSEPIFTRWSSTDPRVTFSDPSTAATTATVAGVGEVRVIFTASVGAYEASSEALLRVIDDEPPSFAVLRVSPALLWPPDHRMIPIHVHASMEDGCDPGPRLRLVGVTSSEPDDAGGLGDGNTSQDIQDVSAGEADLAVLLRAERDGRGTGRTYTLTYEVEDWAGNVTTESVRVSVPHDTRDRARAPSAPPRRGRP